MTKQTKQAKAFSIRATKAQKSRVVKGRSAAALRAHATRALNAAKRTKKGKAELLARAAELTKAANKLAGTRAVA